MARHHSKREPNWGPPILPSTSELHRIGVQDAIDLPARGHPYDQYDSQLYPAPGSARATNPVASSSAQRMKAFNSKAASSPFRAGPEHWRRRPSSGSSEGSDQSSEDDLSFLSPRRTLQSDLSTGNHRQLAASSTAGLTAPARRTAHRLPERALERLDRWAAAGVAASKPGAQRQKRARRETASEKEDSYEPTYDVGRAPRNAASSPPARSYRPTKSSGIPSSAPSLVGLKAEQSGPSAFAVLAEKIGKELDMADRQNRPFRGDSSAETLVDQPAVDSFPKNENVFAKESDERGRLLLPSGVQIGHGAYAGMALPDDVTGLTSAMGSPAKTRQGIRHAGVHAGVGHAELLTRRAKLSDLKSFVIAIEEELEMTKERLDGVEQREEELRDNVLEIRDEICAAERRKTAKSRRDDMKESWETGSPPQNQGKVLPCAGADKPLFERLSNEKLWMEKVAAMTRHVNALSADLQTYRAAMAHLEPQQHSVQESCRADRRGKIVAADSDDVVDEDAEYAKLQAQVDRIESEMERLQETVGKQQQRSEKSQRQPLGEPTSSGRSQLIPSFTEIPVDATHVKTRPRKYLQAGDGALEDVCIGNESRIEAIGDRDGEHAVEVPLDPSDGDEDITQAAARVDRTMHSVRNEGHQLNASSLEHDTAGCTVCLSQQKSHAKKNLRRQRIAHNVRRQDVGEIEEDLLLSFLSAGDEQDRNRASGQHSSSMTLSAPQRALLDKLIKQHLDEFIHQRLLYAELADEVKTMHPETMNRPRRKILIDHVMESVEELEAKARKIENLKRLLPRRSKATAGVESMKNEGRRESATAKRSQHACVERLPNTAQTESKQRRRERGSDLDGRMRFQTATISHALASSPPMVDRPEPEREKWSKR